MSNAGLGNPLTDDAQFVIADPIYCDVSGKSVRVAQESRDI